MDLGLWFEQEGDMAARALFAEIKAISNDQTVRFRAMMEFLRMYTGRNDMTIETDNVCQRLRLINNATYFFEQSLRYNVVQSCVNTLHSKLCKREERAMFLTNNGDWELQRKAQKANRIMYGIFMDARIHQENSKQTLDSYWSGSGFIYVYHKLLKNKLRIWADRVHPAEIWVDKDDAEDGKPMVMRRVKAVDIDALKKAFPDKEAAIELARVQRHSTVDIVSNRALVCEAWRLPDGDGENGKHILAIENVCLREEPWEDIAFPIIKQDYIWSPFGYYGISIPELLRTHQSELNNLVMFRQSCLKRAANPRTYVERSSKVSIDQLTNDPNAIVEYSNVAPQQEVRPPYADQLSRDIQEIYQRAFQEVGISELSASSQKPAGLNSGKSLRIYSDIESERFQTAGQNRKNAHLDIAREVIREIGRINKKIKAGEEGYKTADKSVLSYDKELGVEKFDLTDFEILDNEYLIQIHDTSMLPEQPEGQLAFVEELSATGFLEPEESLELLEFPDTAPVIKRKTAARRYARQIIERMLDEKIYIPPDPYEDHAKNFAVAQQYYAEAKIKGMDEESKKILRQYMDANEAQIEKKKQALMQQQMAQQQAMAPQQAPMQGIPPQ